MKCYNERSFQQLGFEEVVEYLKTLCRGELTKEFISSLEPSSDYEEIKLNLQRTIEFKSILESAKSFPSLSYKNVDTLLGKLKVDGNWLSSKEVFLLLSWLQDIESARDFFKKNQEDCPCLYELLWQHEFDNKLIKAIDKVLDERGNVKDSASATLMQIRKEQSGTSKSLRSLLNRLLKKAQDQNWTIEKEITIRNDRLVIPLKSEARRNIPGFIQDMSQTGGTVYLEPADSLPLNNRLKELRFQEKNEIIRILQELSRMLFEKASQLEVFKQVLTQLDFIQAKAKYAYEFNASFPNIEPDGELQEFKEAYFPVLQLKNKDQSGSVIPLELSLSRKRRIAVISGPNAGGKSVSLKTVGLLQIMLQSGIPIPVSPDATFRIYDSLFINIGDEQSIANDLSTYTSQLKNLRLMGDHMNDKSLFLIDEFGSGTDPRQGGAIAEAFLERFLRQGAYGIITTHYGNIKDFAELHKGIVNAAMEFNRDELRPTYRLNYGIPGRSYAFEIAQRVGVHSTIIKKAQQKVGSQDLDIDKLVKELESKQQKLNRLLSENESKKRKLDKLTSENELLQGDLVNNRKKLLKEAKLEANKLIKEANKKIEQTIREIKERQAEKKHTQKVRKELESAIHEVPAVDEVDKAPKKKTKKGKEELIELDGPIHLGDWVRLKNGNGVGEVVELKGKDLFVETELIKLRVKSRDVVKVQAPRKGRQNVSVNTSINMVGVKTQLDVLGMRVEEALPLLNGFVDQALLSGLSEVRILHGKGSGLLRNAIREYLMAMPFIGSCQDAHIDEGGAGWTIVKLKS